MRKPRDKAKVEVAVLIVERWILARLRHRRFFSLAELNAAIVGRTAAAFGHPVNPHLFRDCAATSIAIDDPQHVRIASQILGHRSAADDRALLQSGPSDRGVTPLPGLPCRPATRQDDREAGAHGELMRAVIYARYSSDLQSACSIEDQVRLYRYRIEAEGWSLVNTYTDPALSGASRLRSGYQKLL